VRLDDPEHIDTAGEQHPAGKPDHLPLVALEVTREQQGERNHPVEDEVCRADIPPSTVNTVQIPGNLVGHVAGPDNKELGKGEIDVEHDEGQGELAQIML